MNTPTETAQSYTAAGAAKTCLPLGKCLLLAVLAGVYIGLAGLGASVMSACALDAGAARILSASVFPAGLAMVILAGSELFTGDCLILIPVLAGKASPAAFLRCLGIVYLGNFAGGLLVAALAAYSHVFSLLDGALAAGAAATAAQKCALPFGDAFLRGFVCNVLVCAAVWMALSAESAGGKVAALYGPIFLFVLCGFEHCVANMYYIPAGLLALREYSLSGEAYTALTWGNYLFRNLLPVTLGNLAGGLLFAGSYWSICLKGGEKAAPEKQ